MLSSSPSSRPLRPLWPFLSLCVCLGLGAQTPTPGATQDPNAGAAPDLGTQRAPMPVPVAFACARGQRKIEIDGSLLDWPELPAIDLQDVRQLSGTSHGAWRSAQDCAGFAFLLWDADALYFAASVKDEWHRELDAETVQTLETPVADSILLSIDPLRNTRSFGPDLGRTDDVEFWLAEEPSHEVMQWDRYRGTANVLDGARLVVSHDKELSITTYELRLPWQNVLASGAKAAAGLVFDLQVVINDFDESTDPMPQTRIGWTFGAGVTADAALFGSAMLLADEGALPDGLPEIPDAPKVTLDERLSPEFWAAISRTLFANPPRVHDGSEAPEVAGGLRRFETLQQLDREIARHPRVDFVEFCQRVHRRMAREVAAAEQRGLPMFWDARARDLSAKLAEPAQPKGFDLARLPQGGWLVRTGRQSFLVDPAGADVATRFWADCHFALLTEPVDMTRRNDQLLLQMVDAKPQRPFLAHIAFHLPKLLMAEMPLVVPGAEMLQSDGAMVKALGEQRDDGFVAYGMGYCVDLPGPHRIVFAGPTLREQDLPEGRMDVLVLSPRNPEWPRLARKGAPDLVVVDDAFCCFALPNVDRVDLRTVHAMQKDLLPSRSLLLAPGESFHVERR